jgi:hypothetical protein
LPRKQSRAIIQVVDHHDDSQFERLGDCLANRLE